MSVLTSFLVTAPGAHEVLAASEASAGDVQMIRIGGIIVVIVGLIVIALRYWRDK